MTSLGLWTAAPKIDAKAEKAEKERLSLDEIAAALVDVNGGPIAYTRDVLSNASKAADEEDRQILELEAEIAKLGEGQRRAWARAQKECPALVGREHKLLFLRSDDTNHIPVRESLLVGSVCCCPKFGQELD